MSAPDAARAGILSSADVLSRTGQTIDFWAASWWQWAFTHPQILSDTDGTYGPQGNVGGPVFYAEGSGGTPVDAAYQVPAGQYILLPIATALWAYDDVCDNGACAAQIVNAVVDGIFTDYADHLYATIDGTPLTVSQLQDHVVRADPSNPFVFSVSGEIFGVSGNLDAVEAGIWIMLDPLTPGTHAFSFGAYLPNLDETDVVTVGDGDPVMAQARLSLTAVPEPETVLLFAIGIGAAALLRRRQRGAVVSH